MKITAALVLYSIFWFVTLFCVLPFGIRSQIEASDLVKGSEPGAPSNPKLRRKLIVTTLIATLLWIVAYIVITRELISISQLNWVNFD